MKAKVKKFLNWIIKDPAVINHNATVADLRRIMDANHATGIPVVNRNKRLCGIITSRDLRFVKDDSIPIKDLMVRKPIVIVGNPTVEQAEKKFDRYKIEKLPVVDEKGLIQVRARVKGNAGLMEGMNVSAD